MNSSILYFTLVKSPKTKYSDAQVLLREFTGQQFARSEADSIWAEVQSHKWNLSEKLQRDVGFRVATIDFFENFYQSSKKVAPREKTLAREIKIPSFLRNAVRFYFESKGNSIYF